MMGSCPEFSTGVPGGHPYLPTLEVGPEYAACALSGQTRPAPLLIDCRREEEVEAVALPNHLHIPLDELAARTAEVEQALAHRQEAKSSEILVMCHHGRRSLYAANTLKAAGFEGARSIVGGIDLWARLVDRGLPRYTKMGSTITLLPPEQGTEPG